MLTVSVLVCAMVALARADAENELFKRSSSCPSDSIMLNGRCFNYVSAKMSWGDAEKHCLTNGAHLASVHSADEYYVIQRMITKLTNGFGRTWLGGSDCQKEGVWLWSDGTPFDYRHKGKFDNRWWKQHCLQMNYGEHKLWDDVQCSSKLPSVCAKKSGMDFRSKVKRYIKNEGTKDNEELSSRLCRFSVIQDMVV